MDSHAFPMFLGKSGTNLIYTLKLCASLLQVSVCARRGGTASSLGSDRSTWRNNSPNSPSASRRGRACFRAPCRWPPTLGYVSPRDQRQSLSRIFCTQRLRDLTSNSSRKATGGLSDHHKSFFTAFCLTTFAPWKARRIP